MSYTDYDYKTKKAIKNDILSGVPIKCHNPGLGGEIPRNGTVYLEGPHYPKPHRWYGQGTMKDGLLVSIK
jgi:hypothetical protein